MSEKTAEKPPLEDISAATPSQALKREGRLTWSDVKASENNTGERRGQTFTEA